MSKVLLDNWEVAVCLREILQCGFDNYYDDGYSDALSRAELCWQNFLTSMVLWDDVYFNLKEKALTRPIGPEQFLNLLSPYIKDCSFIHFVDRSVIEQGAEETAKICELYRRIEDNPGIYNFSSVLLRAMKYIVEANQMGCNYVPHPKRAQMLLDCKVFQEKFDRSRYIDILDEGIEQYIDEVNALCNAQLLTTSFPVLYRFISSHAQDIGEQLSVAFALRENPNVIKFRESVNEIESQLEKGNIQALRSSLEATKEICNDITNEMYRQPLSYGVSVGLSPSLNFNADARKKVKSKLHTTFLYDLASFAIKGETRNRYEL